jgi:hypothetical protein
VIKNVIKGPPRAILVRRLNLFGDVDHMLRETRDVIQPCGTGVFRLAPKGYLSYGDGENLEWRTGVADRDNYGNYTLFHYGYVRRDKEHIRKTIDVQSWFYGPGSTVDSRVLTMDPEGRYEWEKLKPKEWLGPLPMPHPKAAMTWVNRRRTESNL